MLLRGHGETYSGSFRFNLQALVGLIVFDTLGLLLGWRIFAHGAHLGGVLFGV